MKDTPLRAPLLEKARDLYEHNTRIYENINAALKEEEAYAADELVELAEEILHQLAAFAVVQYLKQAPQKEVYNDFLIQLFNSSGHDYNAGPVYRWAANMVKEDPLFMASPHFAFFWEESDGGLILSRRVHHLAELRNQVMHGFFVLPPEKNREEGENMGKLLAELHEKGVFAPDANYHFCNSDGFTGNWNIQESGDWNAYISDTPFGALCKRIVAEQSEEFWRDAEREIREPVNISVSEALKSFVATNTKGAYALWVHPNDDKANQHYAAIAQWLQTQPNLLPVAYSLHEQGLSYTGNFLLQRLEMMLNSSGQSTKKKAEERVEELRSKCKHQVVILLNRVHLALFSPQHVTRLNNFLYENNVLLIGVGHHYEHFNSVFNASDFVAFPSAVPNEDEATLALRNYLRFKGPSHEKADEVSDFKLLEAILNTVRAELDAGKTLYARRFADEFGYDIEYVHEIFALLHPWVKSMRDAFEADTVDELYGFPSIMTEVTPIYLALGRRDLKLEYQHKIITLK